MPKFQKLKTNYAALAGTAAKGWPNGEQKRCGIGRDKRVAGLKINLENAS